MYTTRILLALLVLGAAACGSDTTAPEPAIAPVFDDGSPIMGSGGKTDSTTTTSSDSTTT